jgi:gluconolactonase
MEAILSGYVFPEAPRVDAAGRLHFSDIIGGGVYRVGADGSVDTVIPKRRGVGGLVFHADGGLVVSGRDVVHVRDGVSRPLLHVEGALGFNDLTTDATGRVYVGSMRSGADLLEGRVPSELWRIDGAGGACALYDGVQFPNGVGFSPDGRTLYHSDYAAAHVLAHTIGVDGRATERRIFAAPPRGRPDGLAIDEAGGVLTALGDGCGVARFRGDGTLDRVLAVPAAFVASLCFGGADRRDLYVVGVAAGADPARGGTIWRTRVDVPGLIPPLARV